jgi:hypothetical protein
MSGALLDAPTLPLGLSRSRPTLEDLLASTLHAARTQAEADCPLCEGPMHFADGAARCDSCGSTLS